MGCISFQLMFLLMDASDDEEFIKLLILHDWNHIWFSNCLTRRSMFTTSYFILFFFDKYYILNK